VLIYTGFLCAGVLISTGYLQLYLNIKVSSSINFSATVRVGTSDLYRFHNNVSVRHDLSSYSSNAYIASCIHRNVSKPLCKFSCICGHQCPQNDNCRWHGTPKDTPSDDKDGNKSERNREIQSK
jgi:hypothetical protein